MHSSDQHWNSLYKIGGVASVIFLIYSVILMVLMFTVGGMPGTAEEGFTLLQENRLVGLLRLDVLTILVMPLYYLIFLGLYGALKKTDSALALLATSLAFAGVTLILATPSALSFLALSDKYAAASSEMERALFLAAGEAVLASDLWHGSGALMGGLLVQIGALIISVVMLQSQYFSKLTAWTGVATHGLDLLRMLTGFFFPVGGIALMMVAGPLYLVWLPLLAWDFFRLGRGTQVDEEKL